MLRCCGGSCPRKSAVSGSTLVCSALVKQKLEILRARLCLTERLRLIAMLVEPQRIDLGERPAIERRPALIAMMLVEHAEERAAKQRPALLLLADEHIGEALEPRQHGDQPLPYGVVAKSCLHGAPRRIKLCAGDAVFGAWPLPARIRGISYCQSAGRGCFMPGKSAGVMGSLPANLSAQAGARLTLCRSAPPKANQPPARPDHDSGRQVLAPAFKASPTPDFYPPAPKQTRSRLAEAAPTAAELEAARSHVAERLAELADKTADRTREATSQAVAAGRTGLAGGEARTRERAPGLPAPRQGRERTRLSVCASDWRAFLMWLHRNVLDSTIERLVFARPGRSAARWPHHSRTKPRAATTKTVPYWVFNWALVGRRGRSGRMHFVDYGAGKGRALLLASMHPFAEIGGIEFAEELHDDATMNIAQFSRSHMKCRKVECMLEDVANVKSSPRKRRSITSSTPSDGSCSPRCSAGSSRPTTPSRGGFPGPDRHGRGRDRARDRGLPRSAAAAQPAPPWRGS